MKNKEDPLRKPITFRPTNKSMESECMTFLQYNLLATHGQNDWINKACQFYYDYEQHKDFFLMRIFKGEYGKCRDILRKVGRILKKANGHY